MTEYQFNDPPRPRMPSKEDQDRAAHQGARYAMLCERADDLAKEWLESYIDPERLRLWGHPDTSACPLVGFAKQASTPGLYVKVPEVRNHDGTAGPLIGDRGLLSRSMLWPRMQRVQYFAAGMTSVVLRVAPSPTRGLLTYRIVPAHNVVAIAHPEDPTWPIEVRELRLRSRQEGDRRVRQYTWDRWVADGDAGLYQIRLANGDGSLGEDVTSLYAPHGTLEGDEYPYREDGRAVLPYIVYRAADDGTMWGWDVNRGVFRGSLNAMLLWSYAMHTARDASGNTAFAVDLEPLGMDTTKADNGGAVHKLPLDAGSITRWKSRDDSQHQGMVITVGPGQNMPDLLAFAQAYELNQYVRMGVNPTDITRTNNTPTSGTALHLSNEGKRQLQEQYEPLFRASDLQTLRVSAVVAAAHRIGSFPTDGYSITYARIPKSHTELAAEREHLDWQVEHGLITPAERYRQIHPGTTDQDALDAMAESLLQRGRLELAADSGRLRSRMTT